MATKLREQLQQLMFALLVGPTILQKLSRRISTWHMISKCQHPELSIRQVLHVYGEIRID
jgi:hypothetical protein